MQIGRDNIAPLANRRPDALEYVQSMLMQLANMAQTRQEPFIAYLITMACMETNAALARKSGTEAPSARQLPC